MIFGIDRSDLNNTLQSDINTIATFSFHFSLLQAI